MLFVVALIGLLSTLAIPGLMRAAARRSPRRRSGRIQVVNSAQLSFAITCGLGSTRRTFRRSATLPPGAAEAFLAPEMADRAHVHQERLSVQPGGHVAWPVRRRSCNGLGCRRGSAGLRRLSPIRSTDRHQPRYLRYRTRTASSTRTPTSFMRDHAGGRPAGRGQSDQVARTPFPGPAISTLSAYR